MQLKIYLPILCLAACACLAAAEPNPIQILAHAPLRFEPSAGGPAEFIARGARFRFEFSPHQAVLRSGQKNVRLSFAGANQAAQHSTRARLLPSTTNLYLGNDPSKWRHAIPNLRPLEVDSLVPGHRSGLLRQRRRAGIRSHRESRGRSAVTLRWLRVEGSGLIQKHPVAYQIAADGSRHTVTSSYRKNADGSLGFRLGAYDRSRSLVIDPDSRGRPVFRRVRMKPSRTESVMTPTAWFISAASPSLPI